MPLFTLTNLTFFASLFPFRRARPLQIQNVYHWHHNHKILRILDTALLIAYRFYSILKIKLLFLHTQLQKAVSSSLASERATSEFFCFEPSHSSTSTRIHRRLRHQRSSHHLVASTVVSTHSLRLQQQCMYWRLFSPLQVFIHFASPHVSAQIGLVMPILTTCGNCGRQYTDHFRGRPSTLSFTRKLPFWSITCCIHHSLYVFLLFVVLPILF